MSEFCAKARRASLKDEAVPAIALRQWGVVSAAQLLKAGLDKDAILYRVRTGRLHRVHHGVYAVGHLALSRQGRCMAAVLAHGGPYESSETGVGQSMLEYWGAAISHRSAAELWKLLTPGDGPIDVSIPGDGGRRKRRGIRAHRSLTLLPAHVTLCHGIPVTTPARTIADLRRVASRRGQSGPISSWELRRAIRQAEVLGLPLGDDVEGDGTRSDLESDFLDLCRRYRLPVPEVNVRVGPHLVDFLWRAQRLIVETDGYEYHRGRQAFQDDRGRDLDLFARGYQVIRVAEKQVNDEPGRVAEVVGAALRVRADGR